jgi:hypothetical protein
MALKFNCFITSYGDYEDRRIEYTLKCHNISYNKQKELFYTEFYFSCNDVLYIAIKKELDEYNINVKLKM